jgi:hypothetical protein
MGYAGSRNEERVDGRRMALVQLMDLVSLGRYRLLF